MRDSQLSQPWIFSRSVDLATFLTPVALAFLALLLVEFGGVEGVPLLAYVVLVVAFDVSHVWATLFRSYLDSAAFQRRRWLFLLPIPLLLLLSFRLHQHSETLFWTLVAYIAIHHFISQNYGFMALYKVRAGDREDRLLDKVTLWTGALAPVLLWHASPDRRFDWFDNGEEFLLRLPSAIQLDILIVATVVLAVFGLRQLHHWRSGRPPVWGKIMIIGLTWLTWGLGLHFDHPLVSLAFLNLFHGIPFLVLVWFVCHERWRQESPQTWRDRVTAWLSGRQRVLPFLAFLFVLAALEELCWDGFIWRRYADWTRLPEPGTALRSGLVAVLAFPQLLHYFLDAWIWKFDGTSPDLDFLIATPSP